MKMFFSSFLARENDRQPSSRIEKLENNRTVIHVGDSAAKRNEPNNNVSNMIQRFNTYNSNPSSIWDGQYSFTNDNPPVLLYHVRLPAEASMDTVRIQPLPESNTLKLMSEEKDKSSNQADRFTMRSIPRYCRLPRDYNYDYSHLRVIFLRDNFIRIEVPVLN